MLDRAYSLLHVRSFDEDKRIIRGVATTPEADRVGDVVVSTGVTFKNPMPLLWQHEHAKPVGRVTFDPPTDKGITFEAWLPTIAEPGVLKDRVDEAWHSVRAGLVTAVSIGFRALDGAVESLKDGGLRFLRTEVLELSLVTVPANASATITEVKAIDARLRAKRTQQPRGDTKVPTPFGPIAAVRLTRGLELHLHSLDARAQVTVKLTRIAAQELADALLEYAGAPTKGYVLGNSICFPAQDQTPVPAEFRKSKGAVRFGGAAAKSAGGAVRLTRAR